MGSERSSDAPQPGVASMKLFGWRASFLIGAASLILGLIVAFRPTQSLNAIAVLLGILAVFSGVFQLVAAVDAEGQARMWHGIAGVLFILGGVVLLRHLHLSLALIGLIIGAVWVVQGVAALLAGVPAMRSHEGGGWLVIFGAISLIAGIIVISTPVASLSTLATFLGIWFAIMGVFQMVDAVISRRGSRQGAGPVNVPGQRGSDSAAASRATTARHE